MSDDPQPIDNTTKIVLAILGAGALIGGGIFFGLREQDEPASTTPFIFPAPPSPTQSYEGDCPRFG